MVLPLWILTNSIDRENGISQPTAQIGKNDITPVNSNQQHR